MATNVVDVPAPPHAVWNVLTDATAYAQWVIGPRRVVFVDDAWPLPGSGFVHEESIGPVKVRDETTVVSSGTLQWLHLRAKLRPFGLIAEIRIELEGSSGGTRVWMSETPSGGPIARIWNPLFDRLMHVRNSRSLQKLASVVVCRAGASPVTAAG